MTNPKFDAAFWDERYASQDYAYGQEPNAFLTETALEIPLGRHVLVPGDGEGRNGVWLARQGYEVTTVDLSSQEGCAKARKLAEFCGVSMTVICADLAEWH